MYLVISAFIIDEPYQQVAGDWGKYFLKEDFHDSYSSVRYHSGDQIKEDEMDRAFGMYGGVKNKQVLFDTKETPLGRPGIDGMGSCEHLSDDKSLENSD